MALLLSSSNAAFAATTGQSPPYQGAQTYAFPCDPSGGTCNPQNQCETYLNPWTGFSISQSWCNGDDPITPGNYYGSTSDLNAAESITCPDNYGANCWAADTQTDIYLSTSEVGIVYHTSSSQPVSFSMNLGYTGAIEADGVGYGYVELDYFVVTCNSGGSCNWPSSPTFTWIVMQVTSSCCVSNTQKFGPANEAYIINLGNPTLNEYYGFYGGPNAHAGTNGVWIGTSGGGFVHFYPDDSLGYNMEVLGFTTAG